MNAREDIARRSLGLCAIAILGALAGCRSDASPTSATPATTPTPTVSIVSLTGQAPVVTAEQYPTPHPYPSVHANILWPSQSSATAGLYRQVVISIVDGSGALVGMTQNSGQLTVFGANQESAGMATYGQPPFQGTITVRLSKALCADGKCLPSFEICAPGGLLGTPACSAITDLPRPYVAEVTRSVTFGVE